MKKLALIMALILASQVPAFALVERTIRMDDATYDLMTEAYCSNYGYQAEIDGQANPQTCSEFTRAKIVEGVKAVIANYSVQKAMAQAQTSAANAVNESLQQATVVIE